MGRKLVQVDRLHNQAEAVLLRRLAKDSQDAEALLRLGDLHRRMGDFRAASEAYGRLRTLRPSDRRGAWLHSITAGRQLPAERPQGPQAAPFVHIRNFLSRAERERLLSAALAMRGRFAPGGVGRGADRKVRLSERHALEAKLHPRAEVCTWFVPKLLEVLPRVSTLLRIDGLDQRRNGLTMVAHPDGGGSTPHTDSLTELASVCYFHPEPRLFSGGDLLLYDTEIETDRYCVSDFSRVAPVPGSIVFFPGGYGHEITPVACKQAGFAAARLSVLAGFALEAAGASSRTTGGLHGSGSSRKAGFTEKPLPGSSGSLSTTAASR